MAEDKAVGTSGKQSEDGEEKQDGDSTRCCKEPHGGQTGNSEAQEAVDLECSVAHKHVGMSAISSLQMIAEMYSDGDQ